jgi:hypothetical protein
MNSSTDSPIVSSIDSTINSFINISELPIKTITVYGGLGNQLFQLFTLLAYNHRTGEKVCLFQDLLSCKRQNSKGNLSVYWNTPVFEIFNSLFKDNCMLNVINFKNIKWVESHYVSLEDHLSNQLKKENIFFQGCFQSYLYFDNERDYLFRKMNLLDIQKGISEKYNYNYSNVVSLHFRVGDYLNLQQYHPLLPINYYLQALEKLKKDTDKTDWIILYFYEKNDQEYVNKNIRILMEENKQMMFLPIDHNIEDWEQIIVMSLCKHNIIANSTFSWWGAYFGYNQVIERDEEKSKGKIEKSDRTIEKSEGTIEKSEVYYPSLWHGPALNYIDNKMLFPKEWTMIDV